MLHYLRSRTSRLLNLRSILFKLVIIKHSRDRCSKVVAAELHGARSQVLLADHLAQVAERVAQGRVAGERRGVHSRTCAIHGADRVRITERPGGNEAHFAVSCDARVRYCAGEGLHAGAVELAEQGAGGGLRAEGVGRG